VIAACRTQGRRTRQSGRAETLDDTRVSMSRPKLFAKPSGSADGAGVLGNPKS
jgi:hypothetical protein